MKRVTGATVLILAVAGMVALDGIASAAGRTTLKATLNAKQQVPPQVVKASAASGRFAGTLVKKSNGRGSLSWHLTYRKLSSRVTVAYVVVPSKANSAQFVVALCQRCKPRSGGILLGLPKSTVNSVLTRPGYVVIRTKKNPKGEIRGKLTIG
jgi:CHRD domain-containing protein